MLPFSFDRHIRATKAQDHTDHQPLLLQQHTTGCMSKQTYTAEHQLLGFPKARSMPSLRRSGASSFTADHSNKFHQTLKQPSSPNSTISSRRSISGIKQLLPLRLQPSQPLPKADVSSWLDDSVRTQQPDAVHLHLKQGPQNSDYIPWMLSPQDLQFSPNIHPRKYRETPIYSEPGSPTLVRAYLESSSCEDCPTTGPCDELCILSDYADDDIQDSASYTSYADYDESLDKRKQSAESPPISYTTTRVSDMSIRCRGDQIIQDSSTLMFDYKGLLGRDEEIYLSGEDGNCSQSPTPEGWIYSDSSRSVSPSRDHVYNASITKLAPAKASVIEVMKTPQPSSEHIGGSRYLDQQRPPTPFCFRDKPRDCLEVPPLKQTYSGRKREPIPQGPQIQQPTLAHDGGSGNATLHASLNRSPSQTQRNLMISRLPTSKSNEKPQDSIVEAIRRAVEGFPQDMLFLDTPCVDHIRLQNHLSSRTPMSHSLSNRSQDSEHHHPSKYSPPLTLCRMRVAANLFESLTRLSMEDATSELEITSTTSTLKPPPCTPMVAVGASESFKSNPPDLTAFRRIFSSTDDWWRNVLYAHLVAYNYIQSMKPNPRPNVSSKFCRTLGTPRGASDRETPRAGLDSGLLDLEFDLASCINRIINCMTGRSNALRDSHEMRLVEKDDGLLVKALAEIVKICETNYGLEY